MTQDVKNPLHYSADEGKTFVRISDSTRIGWEIYLAVIDSIENYEELDMTDEEKEIKRKEEERHTSISQKRTLYLNRNRGHN